jgi:UDP-glucose 4-epimerase
MINWIYKKWRNFNFQSNECVHLVLGGTGFIGSNLVSELLHEKLEVLVVDADFTNRYRKETTKLAGEAHYNSIKGDLNKRITVLRIKLFIRNRRVIIWHLAANSDIKSGSIDLSKDVNNTFLTTFKVVQLIRELHVTKVNFASTSAVYGDLESNQISFIEESPKNPISYYGLCKLASERILEIACERGKIPLLIFRFANIVGTPSTHGIIHDLISKIRNGSRTLEVLGDGSQTKTYMHVNILIKTILGLFNENKAGVFNISYSDQGCSVRDISLQIQSHSLTRPQVVFQREARVNNVK